VGGKCIVFCQVITDSKVQHHLLYAAISGEFEFEFGYLLPSPGLIKRLKIKNEFEFGLTIV